MGADMWAKVVQRGVLVRACDGTSEALLMQNPDGTWELPGGKLEHGDTAGESLEREIREETNLVVTAAAPIETAVRTFKKRKNRGKFGVVYRCEFEGDAVELSDEHVDFAWMDDEAVAETNLKQVDEYRTLRRVLAEEDDEEVPTGTDAGVVEGEGQ